AGEGLAGVRLRLGQLVLVVRELQVEAAAVDVEGLAQELHAHGRALDVPARPAGAPGAVPGRLARLGPLPQGEVAGVALPVADLDAGAGLQLLRVPVAQFAVVGVLRDVEVDVAAGRVGEALVVQPGHDLDHLGDVLGRPGHVVDAGDVEPSQAVEVIVRHAPGQLRDGGAQLPGPHDQLVVHVGDVDDEGD